jgi:hypothetical protein
MVLCYTLLTQNSGMQPQAMWQQLQQCSSGSTQSRVQISKHSAARTQPQLSTMSFFKHSLVLGTGGRCSTKHHNIGRQYCHS